MKNEDVCSKTNILKELSKIQASQIMIPLSEVTLINKNMDLEKILSLVEKDGHSRYPVYDEKVDNIIGILYVKDLLIYLRKRKKFNIHDILRKPIFVPENKIISELLKDFKERRLHIAIVVNEYGSMVGIVCLEDIIEELIGDVEDEYDKEEKVLYKKISDDKYIVSPKMKIEEFNKIFKTKLGPESLETLGGYILNFFGYVPKEGESFKSGNYKFTVNTVLGSRIKEILLEKIE
jgi:putative hemolysin